MTRSSSDRVQVKDPARSRELPPVSLVTTRIGEDFGLDDPAPSAPSDELPPTSARPPRLAARDRSADRTSSTARWPPERAVAPGRGPRNRPGRPRFPDTLAMWAAGRAPLSPQGSALGASLRALAEAVPVAPRAVTSHAAVPKGLTAVGRLERQLLAGLGSRAHVPRSSVASHEIGSMGLDHRQAFILSLVDGATSIGTIVESCGMDELDALSVLCRLQDQGLIDLVAPR